MYFFIMFYIFVLLSIFFIFAFFMVFIEEKIMILEWSINYLDFMFNLKFYFYFDYISGIFLLIVSLISSMVFYFSYYYMELDKYKNKFIFMTLLFVISMFLVVSSMNLLLIMIGWDGLGVVSFFLVIHYHSEVSNYSGVVTVLTNRLGDVGMIFSIYFLLSLSTLDILIVNLLESFNNFFMIFVVLGCFTKSAQFPFSAWLPLAMAAPTPISSLVHSSTLVTAGVYIFIRFYNLFKNDTLFLLNTMLLAMVTLLISSFSALVEIDVKKIIAQSTMSQLSLMMISVFLGNEILSFFHIMTHALFKALMFLCSGVFIHEMLENQDVRNFMGLYKINILILSIFFVSSLSLMGFPFLSGFYSKDLILEKIYSLNYNSGYLVLFMLSMSLTVFYSLRLLIFGLMQTNSNYKLCISILWSNIYSPLMFLFILVLFSGSMLNWLIMEKLEILIVSSGMKMFSLVLMMSGGLLFVVIWKFQILNYFLFYYFNSMFYLTKYQGYLFNNFFGGMVYFSIHLEHVLELVLVKKSVFLMNQLNKLFFYFKFFLFYMSFLFFLIIYYYSG